MKGLTDHHVAVPQQGGDYAKVTSAARTCLGNLATPCHVSLNDGFAGIVRPK